MPFSVANVTSQGAALRKIVEMQQTGSIDPVIRRTAQRIISDCDARDDLCELNAIYEAVKHGTDKVGALRRGFKYVADPNFADFYTGAKRSLSECVKGACAGDCDDHSILVGALAASIGFVVGARAWGPKPGGELVHVYCIVKVSKRGPWPRSYTGHGMDTTVEDAEVGWEPPKNGRVITAWAEGE